MKHTDILRRAWHITWRYRLLWIFGLFMAAMGGSAGSGGGGSSRYSTGSGDWPSRALPPLSERDLAAIAAIAVGFVAAAAVFALLLALVSTVLRYVAETAVIRAVDDYENTGLKRTFGSIFRLGWSRRAVRLFLADLVFSLPVAIVFAVLALLALSPLFLWATGSDTLAALGTIATVIFFALIVALGVAVGLAWSLLQPFAYRAAALEGLGVFASLRRGYAVVRARFRDAALMWLLLVVVQILFGLATVVILVALGLLGLLAGGLLGYAVYALSSLAFHASTSTILALVAGVPVGLLVVGLPLLLLSAVAAVFKSAVWTLTFRELSPAVADS